MDTSVKRGDIYYADLSPVVGSEQGGVRPVLIIQNDTGNRYSPTVIAAAITSQTGKARWFERSVSSAIHRPGAAAEAVSWPPGNAWFDRRVLLKRAFRPFQGYRFFRSDNQYGGT